MANGLDAQRQIFSSNPDDRKAFEALEEHFFLNGDWQALDRIYRDRLEAPGIVEDIAQKIPLLFRLGQILEERILDSPAAIEIYWTLARLDPTNRPALRQLRGIYERAQKWDLVLQIAELEGATLMPVYERAEFESELARTWQFQLKDTEEARAAYERALKADPNFPAALEGLAVLHQQASRFEEASKILSRLTNQLRGPERAPVWLALGTLYVKELGKPARARQCFKAALDDDPFQAPAVEWSLLLATADEDWGTVSELLERRFDLAAGARHRAAVAVEASQIQLNHQGSRASARAWSDRALELAPNEISVLLAVAEVERADGDRQALLATLDSLITVSGQHAPRSVLVETAELHSELGNPDAALEAIRRAGEKRGHDDGRVLTLQARLLREAGSKRELAEVLEILTALEGEKETVAEWLRELACLQEESLGDENAAEANWRRAFDLNPTDAEAFAALERIYRKSDDWEALRGLFETARAAANEDSGVALSTSLGMLLLEQFDEASEARTLFTAALAQQPNYRAALVGLRRIAENSGDPELLLEICEGEAEGCRDAEQMVELAQTAIPILRDGERNEEALSWAMRWTQAAAGSAEGYLCRVEFEALLGRVEDEIESHRKLAKLLQGHDRCDSLRRQSELHIQRGDDAAAGIALKLAVEDDPRDRETLRTLCSVYRRLQRPQELIQTLRLLVDNTPTDERGEPLEELAVTLHDSIGDLDAAIVVRWQLADLPFPPIDAATKLEGLLEMAGRYAELAQRLHTRRQQLGDESPEALALDVYRGRVLLDSLGQSEEATEIFTALHERHPEDEEILNQLERALRVGNNVRGLCDLIEKKAGWESDTALRSTMHLERASLLEESLGEPLLACDLYEEIIRIDPESENAATSSLRLESLLDSSGQWQRLRDRLVARVDDLPEEEQATLRERIAAICLDHLNDVAGCAAQLEMIAEIVTDRVHVWQQLADFYANDLDRPTDWLRVVEAELDAGPEPEREVSLRAAAARLLLDDERRPDERGATEAYPHYERILAIRPSHAEAAEVLASYFTAEGRPDDTVRILESRLDGIRDATGPEANDLRLRIATLLTNSLGQDNHARTLFEAARAELGAVPQAAEPLAELYERIGDYEELSKLCQEAIELPGNEAGRLRWQVRLGESESKRGCPKEAAAAYRTVLAASPGDREIEDVLIELYGEIGETDALVELLEKRLPFAPEEEVIDLRLRLSDLYAENRDEPLEALECLERILESHPHHRDAFDRALRLADRIGDPDRLLNLLDRALDNPLPTSERAIILEQRGLLLADVLDRPEGAVANLREALSLDLNNRRVRQTLRRELEKLNRWPAVLDCLFVEARAAEPEKRVELFEEAAEIARSHINPDASLPWLARLRAERPEDPQLLARLADVHHRAGRVEAALRAHDDELLLAPDPSRRHDLYIQRARILEGELQAPGRAIFAYQNALVLAEDKTEILVELDRLYDTMGRPHERADILEARVSELGAAQSVEEGITLRQMLSSLYCTDLAKPELALPHLHANVEATRGDARDELIHLGALDAALRASSRHHAWAIVAERELELIEADHEIHESTPREYVRYLRENLAHTCDVELGDPDRAIQHLRLLRDSEHTPENRSSRPAQDHLYSLLRRTGRSFELAIELAKHLETGGGTAAEWLELGRLREERLADLSGAIDAYQRAGSDRECQLDAIRGRRRCHERLRDWNGLADALEIEFSQESNLDIRERVTIACALGDVCWQRLGSSERAVAGYELALGLAPDDLTALRSLLMLKEECSELADILPLYERELELLGDGPTDRARGFEIWLRLAALHRDVEDSPIDAIAAFEKAASLDRLSPSDELCMARLCETVGDAEKYSETFGRWCDREDSEAEVTDHIELARHFSTQERIDSALNRAERATAVAPESPEAWALLAELQRDAGNNESAIAAFERAADHATASDAAIFMAEAAASLGFSDLDRAHALLTKANELDAGALIVHVLLTRLSNEQQRDEQTRYEAETALELSRSESLDPSVELEIALLGGRAARGLGDRDASRRFFATALELDPDQIEALEGKADADFEDEDFGSARSLLERRLALGDESPMRSRHHSMIARCLEAEDLLDAAWAQYEEAIEVDSSNEEAHEGLVRVHERAARTNDALLALERWANSTSDPEIKALASLRAAEHVLDDPGRAKSFLELATTTDPTLTPAWVLLCQLVADQGIDSESRRVCDQALDAIEPSPLSGQILLRAAKLAEIAGENEEAVAKYAEASRWEPRLSEAALCESRLIRMTGDWAKADDVLQRFIDATPDADCPTLAHVHLERGLLLSGPLEKFEPAIEAYERALVLQPGMVLAQTALAGLLLHSSERWREALVLHRQILEASPTTAASLRAIAKLATQRDQTKTAEGALCVLRALGLASPREADETPGSLSTPINSGPPMTDADAERLRRIAHHLSDELGPILASVEVPTPDCALPEVSEAIEQITQIENELSAPRLTALCPEERASLFSEIAAILLDPGGNGGESRYREALDQTLGRWNRRKIRRIVEETSVDAIKSYDHTAWGNELRAIAAAQTIDRNGRDMRSVLRALLVMENENPSQLNFEDTDISTLVSSSDSACRLLVRITTMLCERLEHDR